MTGNRDVLFNVHRLLVGIMLEAGEERLGEISIDTERERAERMSLVRG